MSNKSLKALLEEINNRTDSASSSQDILDAIELAKNYNGKLHFDNRIGYGLALIGILCIAGHFLALYENNKIMLIGFLVFMLALIIIFNHKNLLNKTSDNIYIKNMLFKNKMLELDVRSEQAQQIEQAFKEELSRGNHTNKLVSLYEYRCNDMTEMDYYCYQYHYTEKISHSSSDNNSGSSSNAQHHDRYGFITTLYKAHDLQILEDRRPKNQIKFTSDIDAFNKRFKVGANSNADIASILNNNMVSTIVDTAQHFKGLNIEINSDGFTCISFKDSDVFGVVRQFGIENPNDFYTEISTQSELKKLGLLIALATAIDNSAVARA